MSSAQDWSKQQLSVKDVAKWVKPVWIFDTLGVSRAALDVLREISTRVSVGAEERQGSNTATEVPSSGTIALFAGVGQAGKAAAAEALANELRLPLYRIDLAHLATRYIGETEKNLALLFPPVETGWPILLFDEGDALFGKRTAVVESHDRYAESAANLAQQMQNYPGLILVATRSSDDLDPSLMSRLAYSIQFS